MMEVDSSSSSELTSSDECDSDDSSSYKTNDYGGDNFEIAKVLGEKIELPQGLCENKQFFKEIFTVRTWHQFSDEDKQRLRALLPNFPENDVAEKNTTLQRLFSGENVGFSNPIDDFHKHLQAGHYRPDIARMRSLMRSVQRRESKNQRRRYLASLVKDVLTSQEWLMKTVTSLPPGAMETTRLAPPIVPPKPEMIINDPIQRTKRRYFHELATIRNEVGETGEWSEDENYPEGIDPPLSATRNKQRKLNSNSAPLSPGAELNIISTTSSKPNNRCPPSSEIQINDDMYRSLLVKHKSKRVAKVEKLDLNSWSGNLKDIASRTLLANNNKKSILSLQKSMSLSVHNTNESKTPPKARRPKKPANRTVNAHDNVRPSQSPRSLSDLTFTSGSELDLSDLEPTIATPAQNSSKPSAPPTPNLPKPITTNSTPKSQQVTPPVIKQEMNEPVQIKIEEDNTITQVKSEPSLSSPSFNMITNMSQYGKVQPATLSDLEGIDMLNLPVDLDESNIGILDEIGRKTPELMQETHSNFFSLIRDIICSTPDYRMSYATLEKRMKTWQENPISPLNDWYNLVDNWLEVLPCAVSFLHGDFTEQPEDFVPYLELKSTALGYQWIGAGRDSDNSLNPLFQYWMQHREEMSTEKTAPPEVEVEQNDLPKSPPPPRWPTTWTVRKAEPEEVAQFREQEYTRYMNPHKAFTYRMNGYESVVGPVKGIYNQTAGVTKPRGHTMLTSDRPNFVTILTLVRDATARLPNGEGTRADICELLKSSQYIAPNASDSVLQSVVSGALDRMHTEYDPCVKYDTKRKIWIYLHRNRTESEFEKIHQQHQGMSKHQRKNTARKNKPKKPVEKPTPALAIKTEATISNVTPADAASKRFKVPVNRPTTTIVTTILTSSITTTTNTNVTSSLEASTIKPTPAGTSLLLNQQNVNKPKPQIEKIQPNTTTASIKVLTQLPNSMVVPSDKIANKSTAVTTTVQTLQSIIAPRVNSPILKPGQQLTKAPTGGKSIVKIVNATPQQNKSLINVSGSLITNHQPPQLLVKASQATAATIKTSQSDQVITQISQQGTTGTKTTIIASPSNQQLIQTYVQQQSQQNRQAIATRQIIQGIANQAQIVGQKNQAATLITQTTLPQQIIQMAAGQKLPQTATLVQTKSGGKTTVLTTAQHQFLQNIKQQQLQLQAKSGTVPQTATIINNQQQLIKQQVALQQIQKQLRQNVTQAQSVTVATSKAGTSLLDQSQRIQVTANKAQGTNLTNSQTPLVAKVLTNAAGQVISVESLLAHQKQHGTLPQGTTLRVAGGKLGQTNLIQLSGAMGNQVTQFAVVSQGNLVSVSGGQPRLIASVAQTPQTISTTANTAQILVATPSKSVTVKGRQQPIQTQTTNPSKISTVNKVTHQLINAKFITAQSLIGAAKINPGNQTLAKNSPNQTTNVVNAAFSKPGSVVVSKAGTVTVNPNQTTSFRMINPAGGLNFTHLAGKPILLASKGNTLQNVQGQNIILRQGVTAQGQSNLVLSNPQQRVVVSAQQQQQQQSSTTTTTSNNQSQQIVLGTPLKIQNLNDTFLDGQVKSQLDGNAQQQTVILSAAPSGNQDGSSTVSAQRVVLASQGQGGQLVAQQFLLPQGFQGATINIKTLQGLKVIPISQQGKGIAGRQQVFTRIVNQANVSSTETPTTLPTNPSTMKNTQNDR